MTSTKFDRLFGGPPRKPETPVAQRDMDIAASIQKVTEEIMLRMARHVHAQTGTKNLCLAGGVALAPGADIYAHSAEISYWVADEFWGRGLATFAVREVTDIAQVMMARQEAGVAFEATLQVRNKLLSAYQDIMRMGV